MKKFKKSSLILLLFAVSMVAFSCNSDDDAKEIIPGTPVGTDVRYKLIVSAPSIVTSIKYKKGDGNTGTDGFDVDSPTEWTKTIIVKKPFVTKLEVTFRNSTNAVQNYTFQIYTDGVLSDTQTGQIEIPPTPPTGQPLATATVSKVFTVQ